MSMYILLYIDIVHIVCTCTMSILNRKSFTGLYGAYGLVKLFTKCNCACLAAPSLKDTRRKRKEGRRKEGGYEFMVNEFATNMGRRLSQNSSFGRPSQKG